MKHKIIILQGIFLLIVISLIYIIYPKADLNLNGNVIKIQGFNAQGIVISDNPDFENSRYIELNESQEIALKPGKYYWKPANEHITGFTQEFEVKIDNSSEFINMENVKVNVKKVNGVMVGYVVFEPEAREPANLSYGGGYE
ncbi:MAG: hypothetical protein ACP5OG_00010 [Candidatus Nanoarchaeia archaeon]